MAKSDFNFDLYRLTIHDDESLLDFMGTPIRTDDQIISVVKKACDSSHDHRQEARRATYLWGLRNFMELPSGGVSDGVQCFAVTLAKATVEQQGVIITSNAIKPGKSEAQPPLADVITLIFQMKRHLVAVEYKSTVSYGGGWLSAFHEILQAVSTGLNYRSKIELQPKPKNAEILKTFASFQRLTRIKVELLLPNPELSRLTEKLFAQLQEGGVREYLADMKNPNGLSQKELTLPHAAAAMAEDGYKKGDVILEGIRDGKKETIKTGMRPARGRVDGVKDFVRGLATSAKTKEGKIITEAILKEIDRIAPEQRAE